MSIKITYKNKTISTNKLLVIAFILSFTVVFMENTFVFTYNYFIKYAIAAFWIILVFIKIILSNKNRSNYYKDIKFYFKLYIIPWIVFTINNLFIYGTGIGVSDFFGRSVSSFMTMIITVLVAFATVYLFEEKVIKYSIIVISISFIIITINGMINYGPLSVFKMIYEILVYGSTSINFYEVNDLSYALGLLLIFYLFINKRRTNKNLLMLTFTFVFVGLGLKRIQIIALICVGIFVEFIKRIRSVKAKTNWINLTSAAVLILSYAYVYFIKSGLFAEIIGKFGLNTMGRLDFYTFISKYYEFNLSYLGMGLGFTSKAITTYTSWTYTLHSDILKIYVEMGFIVFTFWIWYSLWRCYKKILKNRSFIEAITYFILTLYLFIMHFTDNTVGYFTTQYIYMLIPICLYIKRDKINIRENLKKVG